MKRMLVALALALAIMTTATVSNAQRSTGETVDDTTIAVTVKAALADSDDVSAADVNVEVYKGAVQISGYVPSDEARSAALKIAGDTDGVNDVHDAMVVMAGKRSVGRTIDDQTIHAQVKLKIAEVSGFGDAVGVVTHVRNGEVILSGFVGSDTVQKEIVAAAESVNGVARVHDRLAIK
jgi:hyperosmotically inducible protein